MNQLQPYEKLIADKFSNAPVPDMMDEIWATVEMQLPVDLSSRVEELEQPSLQPATSNNLATIVKVVVIAALTIVAILLIKKTNSNSDSNNKENLPAAPPAIDKMTIPDSTISEDSVFGNPVKPNKKTVNSLNDSTAVADSIFLPDRPSSDIKLLKAPVDSGKVNLPSEIIIPKNNPIILNPPVQQSSTEKKRKGARGIKDSDYKIIPAKKDSL